MKRLNDIEVIINDKRYTLSGYESSDYLQKIASYLNEKHDELRSSENYKQLDNDMKNVLLQINIADDYYKARAQMDGLTRQIEEQSKDVYDLKHNIVVSQTQLERLNTEITRLQNELHESQKTIVRLETELKQAKR